MFSSLKRWARTKYMVGKILAEMLHISVCCIQSLAAAQCPKYKLRIYNSPGNLLFMARYTACVQADTPFVSVENRQLYRHDLHQLIERHLYSATSRMTIGCFHRYLPCIAISSETQRDHPSLLRRTIWPSSPAPIGARTVRSLV